MRLGELRGYFIEHFCPEHIFLDHMFQKKLGRRINWKNLKTFNEKLQWLKLHDRNPKYIDLVDKYKVKDYIADILGKEYIIPTLGTWESVEEIDFDSLPEQFVLKCTHDSGSVRICKNKEEFDIEEAKRFLSASLKKNPYYYTKEWPYKYVKPRIMAEKYMVDESEKELKDYKIMCFNGVPDSIMLCTDRASGHTKFYFFDKNWNLKRYNVLGKQAPKDFALPKPDGLNKMFEIAERLSQNIPFVRVDLYNVRGAIYFGEMTFYPDSGFDPNLLPETDVYFGQLLDLKLRRTNENNRISNQS